MKKIFPLIALLFFSQVPPVWASGILVVQSLQIKPYNEALRGFRSVCTGATSVVASEELSEANIVDKVRRKRPDLILAIGLDALAKVKNAELLTGDPEFKALEKEIKINWLSAK